MNKKTFLLILFFISLSTFSFAVPLEEISDEQLRVYIDDSFAALGKDKEAAGKLEEIAETLIKSKRLDGAEEIYQKLLSKNPSKKKVFFYNIKLGDISAEKKSYSKSISFYNEAKSLYPKDIDIRLKIGSVFFENNLYSLAQETYLEILKIDKKTLIAKIKLGDIYFLSGDYQNALEYYENIDVKYYNADLIINAAIARRKISGARKALLFMENFIERYDNGGIYLLAGKFYYSLKDYDNAVKNFNSAIRKNENLLESYLYLADININHKNNLDLGDKFLNLAEEISRGNAIIDFLRSQAAYKRGDRSAARQFAVSANKKSKTSFVIQETKKAADFFNAKAISKK